MSKKKYSLNLPEMFGMKKITGMVLGFFILGTAGCCGKSALERDYGNSWVYNEEVQIANPQAAFNETPATGLSPNASTTVMNGYNSSFKRKQSGGGSSTTINLGGLTTAPGSGGGGGDNQ